MSIGERKAIPLATENAHFLNSGCCLYTEMIWKLKGKCLCQNRTNLSFESNKQLLGKMVEAWTGQNPAREIPREISQKKKRTTGRCLECEDQKTFYIVIILRRDVLEGHLDCICSYTITPHPFGIACRHIVTMSDWKTEILKLFYSLWHREPKPKWILNSGPQDLSSQFQLKPSFLPITPFQTLVVLFICTCFAAVGLSSLPASPACTPMTILPPSLVSGASIAVAAKPDALTPGACCVFHTPL